MAFEQNQKIEIEDVKTELGKKVNTSSVRTIEEIQATTDLTGKIASASALKVLNYREYAPSIKSEYGSGVAFGYTIGTLSRFLVYISVTKRIEPWVNIVSSLPPLSIPGLESVDMLDTTGTIKVQYRANGTLYSRDIISVGSYSILF